MVKQKNLWIAIIVTLIVAVVINVVPFVFIKQTSGYFAYVGATVSAANLVVTGFAAGLGFYLAKEMVGK
ncbi:hypothetical protein A3K73_06680 [Candidatus Pacearchaeota archaeon RBG_13_36_9]|nr:MAG: hypothetical protein A3K73_06680 [Candidatus Pacearchaeota archaeon RBG_13_36_9]